MSLSQRILAVLQESPLPVPTPDLIALCAAGATHARQRVWYSLTGLERGGLVRRAGTRLVRGDRGGARAVLWRAAP